MNLRKQAYKRMALEESIKRYKLKGETNAQIAERLGITENRVATVLETSLQASKLQLDNHNKMQEKAGLPLFDVSKVSTDFSALSKLGEAVKNYTVSDQTVEAPLPE